MKTLIQQHVLGAIPGKPVWQSIHEPQIQRLSSGEAFSHKQCKKAQLTLTATEFQNMLTGNMLHEDKTVSLLWTLLRVEKDSSLNTRLTGNSRKRYFVTMMMILFSLLNTSVALPSVPATTIQT